MPSVASTCVMSAGPPPVSRYTLLKSPSVQIIDRMVEVRYSVFIDGQVMKRNFCQLVAPSTDAASYCSEGMARRPATRISVQNGSDFQMCISMEKHSASVGSLSQLGPSRPVRRKISELMTPHSGLSMKRTDRMVGIEGTAQGRMKISEMIRSHQRDCMKKPDSIRATAIFTLIATTRNSTLLMAVRKKIGSSNSLT